MAKQQADDSAMKRLLRDLGRGVASGAAVVGNTLNKPSRALWGSANYLAGGESGGGLLNLIPFSDTMGLTDPNQGIETSDFLSNQGLIPKNDPTKWELGDFGRGALDIAGDPLSWLAPLPLTKLGTAAYKANKLTKGIAPSLASGERALLGLQAPFTTKPMATAFSGAGPAAGFAKASGAIAKSPLGKLANPVGRQMKQWFDPKVGNTITGVGQKWAKEAREFYDPIRHETDAAILPAARELEQAGRMDSGRLIREFRETGKAPSPLDPLDIKAAQVIGDTDNAILGYAAQEGAPLHLLNDPANIRHGARYSSGDTASGAGLLAEKRARSIETRRDHMRQQVLKGYAGGTEGFERIVKDPQLDQFIESRKSDPRWADPKFRKQVVKDLTTDLRVKYGPEIVEDMPLLKPNGSPRMKKDPLTGQMVPIIVSRTQKLAKLMIEEDGWRKTGVFGNHPLVDAATYSKNQLDKFENTRFVKNAIADPDSWDATGAGIKVAHIMRELGLGGQNRVRFVDSVLTQMGQPSISQQIAGLTNPKQIKSITNTALRQVLDTRVKQDVAEDILQRWPAFRDAPELKGVAKHLRNFTALWKAGQLTWPARYVRDISSAFVRLWERGALDPNSVNSARLLIQGEAVPGLTQLPAIVKHLQQQGITGQIDDAMASNAARDLFGVFNEARGGIQHVAGKAQGPQGLGSLTERIPGVQQSTLGGTAASLGKQALGFDEAGQWNANRAFNPLGVRGINDAPTSTFGLAAAGDRIGEFTDTFGRFSGFLNRLKQGVEPEVAWKEINEALVDYTARNFTPTDRRLRAVFPFYSFARGAIPYLAKELATNPAGRLSQTVRATGRTQDQDAFLPEHVAQTTAIPLPFTRDDGSKPFVTGLGLMHEDPLSFAGGGTQGTFAELMSRTNPLIQKPVEWATGQSFFQRGPLGGRQLEDMDPTIGRILSNVGEYAGLREEGKGPVRYPGQKATEFVASSTPISRALTTARTLTDTRKDIPSKLTNVLTGARITDVSPAQQDRVLKDAATALGRQLNAREFSSMRFSKEQVKDLERLDPDAAKMAQAFNTLQSELANRAKARKKPKRKD